MDLSKYEASIEIGRNVNVSASNVKIGRNVRIADNVTIKARYLRLDDNVSIDPHVNVDSEILEVGSCTKIEARCRFSGMAGISRCIQIGEQSLIAQDCKLFLPIAVIGDYVSIHNHCLLNGRKPLTIGHNAWIGQNCVLNAEDTLTIGNNVGFGPYNSVYTHGYFGDLLQGCQVFKVAPIVIEDDVWVIGSYNLISPGVTIGEKAFILPSSIVTKDVLANHTVTGSPAVYITERLIPYRDVSLEEKLSLVWKFVQEFLQSQFPGRYEKVHDGYIVDADYGPFRLLIVREITKSYDLPDERPLLIFTSNSRLSETPSLVTVFNIVTRQYSRARSKPEVDILRFLKPYRARFVPQDRPRVYLPDLASFNFS